MRKAHRISLLLIVAAGAVGFSSCAYDPYYSGSSYSGSSLGFGSGYGYGNPRFATTTFISTGRSQWGYDPYAGAYYDYTRRRYYDPYLNGYYPVGYRPRCIAGAPHPHGWRSGRDYIAPPSRVRNYHLKNYENRGSRYQTLGRDWSRNVRINDRYYDRDQRSYQRNFHQHHRDKNHYEQNFRDQRRYQRDESRMRDRGSRFDQNQTVSVERTQSRERVRTQAAETQTREAPPERRARGTRAERYAASLQQ